VNVVASGLTLLLCLKVWTHVAWKPAVRSPRVIRAGERWVYFGVAAAFLVLAHGTALERDRVLRVSRSVAHAVMDRSTLIRSVLKEATW
jgi:hypothetical protein